MEKKHAFLLAILITALIGIDISFLKASNTQEESVRIVRVIDGDTVDLEDGRTVRLLNINTPEKGDFGDVLAKEYVKKFENKTVKLVGAGTEKYGRTLGRIYVPEYLNLDLVRLGYAHPFIVDDKEISIFDSAEKSAMESELGIWKMSKYSSCFKLEINKKEEYVVFNRLCNVSISGWTVKDESTKRYKFLRDVQSSEFILYSGEGIDGADKRYWGKGNVWNDDGDSLFFRDSQGFLVTYIHYSS